METASASEHAHNADITRPGAASAGPARRLSQGVGSLPPAFTAVGRGAARLWAARARVLRWGALPLASSLTALLASHLFMASAVSKHISDFLAAFNFDPERVLLLDTLAVTVLGCALASFCFMRRLPAMGGGVAAFGWWYLWPAVQQAQHPEPGPDGVKLVLIPGALFQLTTTLLALAVVCAGVGAALGAAYGGLVWPPLALFFRRFRTMMQDPLREHAMAVVASVVHVLGALALAGVLFAAVAASASAPGTILTYGLQAGLYRYAAAPAGHPAAQVHGTLLRGTYPSLALGGAMRTYYIYLPPSYNVAQTERYPTLYLLHGSPGSPQQWVTQGNAPSIEETLLALGKIRETILVSADGTGPVYRFSQWANSFDGRQRMEDAIAQDLVHFIDTHYRTLTDPADRAIGGNSEGGFGAPNVALHHPDLFGAALCGSGYFTAAGRVYGAGPASLTYRAYNSPERYIFTAGGRQAARQITFIIGVAVEDGPLYTDGVNFYHKLLQVGARATLFVHHGGHTWRVWTAELIESFPLMDPPAHG